MVDRKGDCLDKGILGALDAPAGQQQLVVASFDLVKAVRG